MVNKEMNSYVISKEYSWQILDDYCYIQNVCSGNVFFLKGLAYDLWKRIMCLKRIGDILDFEFLERISKNTEDLEILRQFIDKLKSIGVIIDNEQ